MSKISIKDLYRKKAADEKICCLTAYDASFASLMDEAGIDVLLVGDTLGMILQGHKTTLTVTTQDICYHLASVDRGRENALLMADMPFMGAATLDLCLHHAEKLMRAGAEIIKIEGGEEIAPYIAKLAESGVPVCAHLGLTPQHVHRLGGYGVQGKGDSAAGALIATAKTLEGAGAALILAECIPTELTQQLVETLKLPLIGIGAGPHADGQILVMHDALGIRPNIPKPKFVRDFLAGQASILDAFIAYRDAVRSGSFPHDSESFHN